MTTVLLSLRSNSELCSQPFLALQSRANALRALQIHQVSIPCALRTNARAKRSRRPSPPLRLLGSTTSRRPTAKLPVRRKEEVSLQPVESSQPLLEAVPWPASQAVCSPQVDWEHIHQVDRSMLFMLIGLVFMYVWLFTVWAVMDKLCASGVNSLL